MVLIPNTRTINLVNAMTDTKALVNCRDVFDIATMGTDFIFDALNPASWSGNTLPSSSAQIPASGVIGAYITSGGSGGTNGTFALGFSGGGGTGAAGTFTVSGGALTAITITASGSGYTSNPGFTFAASVGLAGAGATSQIAAMSNLARDVQPALARTLPVGPAPFTYASRPTFNGKGLAFVNGTTTALNISKSGQINGRVAAPYHEGFIDFAEIVTCKANSYPVAQNSPYAVTGGNGGIQFNASGVPQTMENSTGFGAAVPTGKIVTVAKRVRFDIGAGTSSIIGYVGVDGIVTPSNPFAGRTVALYPTTTIGNAVLGGTSGAAGGSWNGDIYHVYREFIGVSGRSDSDVLALVKQVYNAALSRWS